VSIALFDVSLRSALDLILRAIDLTWTVRSEAVLITTPEQADGILLTKVYGVADLVTFGNHQDQPPEGCDVLAETITSTVEPNSWEEAGGPGSIRGASAGTAKVLVIRQTYQVHRRIVRLLDQLQAAARSNVEDGPPPARKQHPRVGNDGVGSRE
jgi:hypothetical protein